MKKNLVINFVNVQGKISGEEGWISVGPWGGRGGTYSTYKPDGPVVQITIRYGDVVDSILFESKSRDGVVIGSSVKIGGAGGSSSAKGNISGEEGLISLGIHGGKDGTYWAYRADGPTMQISVRYGQVIDSLLFKSKSGDCVGRSMKIGGSGGYTTITV
ncbi:hypothetical protein RHSIM_Rhsim12G0046100 [Rhododendron simsii]|uniref:Jacalin-type lectin domain-containing protein n=1 Tax=Rhododendron simsii TaxID=118357 RepID=A0A834L7D3_RHOSS|nr:hypothetical protein RHSIM_Rhsim12G0046100 [Rhododendron simsii]